jgi:carbamoyl-phosphate synthase large subunit
MGIDRSFGLAFAKSQLAAGDRMPQSGTVFFSLADRDKRVGLEAARRFADLGFELVATAGTAAFFEEQGLSVAEVVAKVQRAEGDPEDGSDGVALIEDGRVQLVVNSPRGRGPRADGAHLRNAAGRAGIPLLTTAGAASAAANGLAEWISEDLQVRSLQSYHRDPTPAPGGGSG